MYYFGGLFISLIELFFSRGNPPGRRTGYRTIVENLSSRTSWQDLKDFMRKVTNTNLCLNSFLNVMNLTLRDSHDPLCVIILNIIIPNLYSPVECGNEDCDLSLTVVLQAGEITYTNTNQPRVGEGIVEFGSRLARKVQNRKIEIGRPGETWNMLWTSWTARSWTGEGSGWLRRAVAGDRGPGLDPGPGRGQGPGPGNT